MELRVVSCRWGRLHSRAGLLPHTCSGNALEGGGAWLRPKWEVKSWVLTPPLVVFQGVRAEDLAQKLSLPAAVCVSMCVLNDRVCVRVYVKVGLESVLY